VNKQFLEALKAARKEGKIDAIREGMRALHSSAAWAAGRADDTEYHRGLRDGIVIAMEAIGYNRWETNQDTKSGK
jgi:hypothetical protein